MFNRGRPKIHTHIAFFTYLGPDGTIITYEMTKKGVLKQIPNSTKITIQIPRIFTDDCQKEINVNENNEIPLSDQLSMHHRFSNQDLNSLNMNNGSNYIEEHKIPDIFDNDFLIDNPFDEDFFKCITFLKDEPKIDNT